MKKTLVSVPGFLTLLTFAGFVQATTVLAEVELTPGNSFTYTGAGSAVVSSSAAQYARFTAPENTTANSISLNFNSSTATSITYGLQLDDGTGKPDGVFVRSGTITPVAGWNTLTFADYNLVEGQVYHVVTQKVEADKAVSWRLLNGATPQIQSYGFADANFARGTINNAGVPGAASTAGSVVYHIGTNGSVEIGQVYTGGSFTNLTNPGIVAAQHFVFEESDTGNFLESVTVRLSVAEILPANDVTIALLDSSNNVIETMVLSASSLIANAANNYTIAFSGQTELLDGESYNLALYSIGSTSNSVRWAYSNLDNLPGAVPFYSASFQGTDGYGFTYTNTSFATANTPALFMDYVFSYTTTAIPEPGAIAFCVVGAGIVGLALRRRKRD